MNFTVASRAALVSGIAAIAVVALSACGDLTPGNHIEDTSATTGAAAKSDHIAPDWLPDSARDVSVKRRTTGNERILVATYSGRLDSPACFPVARIGAPSDRELSRAYDSDSMTKGVTARDLTDHPSLTASWWPAGQEKKTTLLCGRWWVSLDGGKLYAFSPELNSVVDDPNAN